METGWLSTALALPRTVCTGRPDEAYIADIYYAASAQTVAKAADVLGLEETRQEYQEMQTVSGGQ